jgi:hypothetical protein
MEPDSGISALVSIVGAMAKEIIDNKLVVTALVETLKERDPELYASFINKTDQISKVSTGQYENLQNVLKRLGVEL